MVQRVPQSGISGNSSFKNLFINGDMRVAQRGTSATTVNGDGGTYTLDRFAFFEEGALELLNFL